MRHQIQKVFFIFFTLLCFLIAIYSLFWNVHNFPFISEMIVKEQKKQKDLLRKISLAEEVIRSQQPQIDQLMVLQERSYVNLPLQDLIGNFRERIEKIFNSSGAKIRTIASPKRGKSDPAVMLYELQLTAEVTTAQLFTIMKDMEGKPQFLWKTINLRPNNILAPSHLILNSTITAICFQDETSVRRKTTIKERL